MSIQKNDSISLTITGMTAEGAGVGRYEGMAIFVPCSAPGDQLIARIIKRSKTYAIGKIEQILTPSPDRIVPDCPQFFRCGGCEFRHLRYEAELRLKEQRVCDAISRIGGFSPALVQPILGAEAPDRYRNKAQIPIGCQKDGSLCMGFYANHSHRIVDCPDCRLQPGVFTTIQNLFRAWFEKYHLSIYEEVSGKGCLRHLYLRYAEGTGEIMVCLVAASMPEHCDVLCEMLRAEVPEIVSILLNYNPDKTNVVLGKRFETLWGRDQIEDLLCGLRFSIAPASFYQVNHAQTQRLYQAAAAEAALPKGGLLLDLYCGTGTIGLTIAKDAGRLIGVEIVESAVENARQNARRNGIPNAEFLCMDATKAAARLAREGLQPTVVTIDPPRKGCTPEVVSAITAMQPERIVYVSCDPATLARDLKQFAALGYPPMRLTPVDMFPRTANVETVCLLSKAQTISL